MKAREIYIDSNLILPRSINDARLGEKMPPFRLNTKFDPKEYEVPSDFKLLGHSGKKRQLKKREQWE